MQQDWSPGHSCQLGDTFKPWLYQGCKPYHNLNTAESECQPATRSSAGKDKLQHKENMQFISGYRPGNSQDLYSQLSDHWKGEDDKTLSPYLSDLHFPTSASAPCTELYANQQRDEDAAHDFQLIENLEVPAATTLTRSDSAHALGESIDPELLPDIETLAGSFELPAQLRIDAHAHTAASPAQQSQNSYPAEPSYRHQQQQQQQQPHPQRTSHRSHGGAPSQVGPGLLNSGATASSGAASTASDDSAEPSFVTNNAAAQRSAAHPFDNLHLAYAQSGSLPLLDVDVDALTDQQAAYMLDENQELWDLMQQDEVAELDTSAALEGLDLTSSIPSPAGTRAMSPDTEQPYGSAGWTNGEVARQSGTNRRNDAAALAELDLLNAVGRRKGKGGRQPAMDPRLDPNVDPKRAKRILANRLSAARSKMKQKSHVEALRRQISALESQKKELRGGMTKVKASCELKANENEALRNQIKALEERCCQQAQMTSCLMEKRTGNMRFSTSQSTQPQLAYNASAMQGPYCNAATVVERKPRASLPPSSRNAKFREPAARSAQQSQRVQKHPAQQPARQSENTINADAALQYEQYDQGPLKTWGSTGRRQPRSKS